LLPAMVGILLGGLSLLLFRKSYRVFTRIVIGLSLAALLISVIRTTFFKSKVAADETFDSTLVKTQEGIETDLKDAFDEADFGTQEPKDTTATQ